MEHSMTVLPRLLQEREGLRGNRVDWLKLGVWLAGLSGGLVVWYLIGHTLGLF
jgi:hypothetical protein